MMLEELIDHFVKAAEIPGFITEFNDARLVIAGVPAESLIAFRGGTLQACTRIRESLNYIETLSPFSGLDIIDLKFHDLGDLKLNVKTLEEHQSTLENLFCKILAAGKKTGLMGGDHTVLLPFFSALKKKYQNVGLVVFDAHLYRRDITVNNRLSHAQVLRRVLQAHPGTPILHIGNRVAIRSENKTDEMVFGKIMVLSVLDFQGDIKKTVKENLTDFFNVHQGKIHVSIDMDCFDPSAAPGVSNPEFPGLTALQVFQTLHWIKNDVTSFDLHGFTPSRDVNGTTAILAAKTFCELMYKTEISFA